MKKVLFIFIAALLLRLCAVYFGIGYDRGLHFFDARDYDRYAVHLLSGEGFTNGATVASRPPLYPLFLAGCYRLFGHSYLAVRIIQAILGASLVWPLYGIFRIHFSERLTLWAIGCVAFHPLLVCYVGNILSETLALVLLAFFLFVFLREGGGGGRFRGGLIFGLLLLCRASFIFLLPILILFLLREQKKRVIQFVLALSLTLSPWVIRNAVLLHAFIPLTTNGGTTFWDANNPEALRDPSKTGLASAWIMPGRGAQKTGDREIPLSEAEGDRYLYHQGLRFLGDLLRGNPFAFGYLLLRKLLAAFSMHAGKTILELFLYLALYGALLPLGLWESRRLAKAPLLLYGVILHYLLASLIFFGRAKYRMVIEPYLIIFILLGAQTLFRRVDRKTFLWYHKK